MPTGAELFVRSIKDLGISQIFTLVGDHLNGVLAVAAREGIRILDMRHESGVTHAADAWARLSRKPAISLVTGGPGHTNSLTGIATANLAASPLIAVSGSRATQAGDRGAFQDIDQVGMAKPVAKWTAEPPSAAQIPFYLGRAYQEANTGRKGAVHLTIPVDLFTGKTDAPAAMPIPVEESAKEPGSREIEPELGMNRRLELGICADVRSTLRAFLAEVGEKSWTPLPWVDRLRQLRCDWQAKLAESAQDRSTPMHPAAFFAELKKWLPKDIHY